MDARQVSVRLGRDDGAGADRFGLAFPVLVKAGEREKRSLGRMEPMWDVSTVPRAPFVEAISHDETPTLLGGRAKRWLLSDRLASRLSPLALKDLFPIDQSFAQLGIKPHFFQAGVGLPRSVETTVSSCCGGAML